MKNGAYFESFGNFDKKYDHTLQNAATGQVNRFNWQIWRLLNGNER